jgi:protein-disulfide isomerase
MNIRSITSLLSLVLIIVGSLSAQTSADVCGCEDKPLPEIVASFNGVRITRDQFTSTTLDRVKKLQQAVVDARSKELELQINSRLLEAEGKRRGIGSYKLLQAEVLLKVVPPTDAEAQAFYDQNRASINGDFATVRNDLIAFMRNQREQALAKELANRLRAAAQVKLLATATPPATAADRDRVLATVDGANITSGDIEDSLRPLIFSVQEQVYKLRKDDLDLKINDALLTAEARRRGVQPGDILRTDVKAKLTPVSEDAALKFFNENRERIKSGDFAQYKDQIIVFLTQREEEKLSAAFAEQLRRNATVELFLTAPEQPVYRIATDDQPAKGNPRAAVTVVEFTDYQCQTCSMQFPVMERLIMEYGDRVRFVMRDFPLGQHENALKAAEAAEAAREQGKYWEFTKLMFGRQSALQEEKLKQYATELGLDRVKFDGVLKSGSALDKIQRDQLDGQKVGVNGTPSLFVNGVRIKDISYESLKTAIEGALIKSRPRRAG